MSTLNRREFLRIAAVAPAAAEALWSRAGQEARRRLLFVGTQTESGSSRGIYAYRWEPLSGELQSAGLAAESDNPRFSRSILTQNICTPRTKLRVLKRVPAAR